MSQAVWAPCELHADAMASFRCDGCTRPLCYECVDEGKLVLCRHCGELAVPIEQTVALPDPEAGLEGPGVLHREESADPRELAAQRKEPLHEASPIAASLMTHVVVPAALILMGYSFLSFLVEVRSVYFPGGRALKWLGFFFVVATVLIERYGKVSQQRDRQSFYSFALAAATLIVMLVSPWETAGSGWQGPVLNSLIILSTWKLLTAVTAGISQEGENQVVSGQRLYGLERIALERFQRQRGGRARRRAEPKAPKGPRPTVLVARLAIIALVVFALSEPVLLAGVPEAGTRGLVAMILFFLATGLVLAASSFVELQRRLRKGGGKGLGEGLVGRVGMACVLLVAVLSLSLGLPGVRFQGKSELEPSDLGVAELSLDGERNGRSETPNGGRAGTERDERGQGETERGSPRQGDKGQRRREFDAAEQNRPPDGEPLSLEEERRMRDSWNQQDSELKKRSAEAPKGTQKKRRAESRQQQVSSGPLGTSLLGLLFQLGKWLVVPVVLLVLAVAGFALWRLAPFLLSKSNKPKTWIDRILAWLARLVAPKGRKSSAEGGLDLDPWANLNEVRALEPRAAIVESYNRALLFLHQAGFPRAERQTPAELLETLPARWRRPPEYLQNLTDLYSRAAYGAEDMGPGDRSQALDALDGLRKTLS